MGKPVVFWGVEKTLFLMSFLTALLAGGIFRFHIAESRLPDISFFEGKPVVFRGVVSEEPERTLRSQRIHFQTEFIAQRSIKQPVMLRVVVPPYPAYALGDEIIFRGIIEPSGRKDFLGIVMFPRGELVASGKMPAYRMFLSYVRNSFEKQLGALLPEPHSSLLKGLLLGERVSLPPDFLEDLRRSGTTHIIALSGYNITIVGGFILAVLLFCTIPFRVSFWIASLTIIFFVVMTGASPSVVRAGVMGLLVLSARRMGRPYYVTNAIAFAAAVMILANPFLLRFDVAFELSFFATAGLALLGPYIDRRIGRIQTAFSGRARVFEQTPFAGFIRGIFSQTIAAQLAVLPLLVYIFGRVSIISPLANVFVLVSVPYAMAFGFAAGMISYVSLTLGQIVGSVAWMLLEYQIRTIHFFASLPGAAIEIGRWMTWLFLFVYGLLSSWIIWIRLQSGQK